MALVHAPTFGIATYLYFAWVWVAFIVFVGNYQTMLPKRLKPLFYTHSLDVGEKGTRGRSNALLFDAFLILIFCIQHVGMARRAFKRFAMRELYDRDFERSAYVFASSLCLHLLMKFWMPIELTLFTLPRAVVLPINIAGWVVSFVSTFMVDHWELFGLKQSFGFHTASSELCTHLFYSLIRHPMFTGFLIGVWPATRMTVGHLLLAGTLTLFIVTAVYTWEEPELERTIGNCYTAYKERTPAFCPFMPTAHGAKQVNKILNHRSNLRNIDTSHRGHDTAHDRKSPASPSRRFIQLTPAERNRIGG